MHRVPLTFRRPGQAATEPRSTSADIVALLIQSGATSTDSRIGGGGRSSRNGIWRAWQRRIMNYLTRVLRLVPELHFHLASRVDLPDGWARLTQGYGSCLLVFVNAPQGCGEFLSYSAISSYRPAKSPEILRCARKCLTDFHLGFMMVSSLRKEVVQSNMGICSDCRFIITREVADS